MSSPPQILLVTDMFHPVHGSAVQSLLDGDMTHRRRRRCTVPLLLTGLEPYRIARTDAFDRLAVALYSSGAGDDDQRLPQRVRVPGRARPRFEGDDRAGHSRRRAALERRIDAYRACEPFGRAARRL